MTSYGYLMDLAIILLFTKGLGLLTRKVQMPQVVGALLAGLLLGPACFGLLKGTNFIHEVAEIGVIVLMFCA
ncbi:MAG: cation:proton antiporter, partial [Lachnospiraceae bacterium]